MDDPAPARRETMRAGLVTAHLTRSGGGVFTSVRQFARVLGAEPGLQVEVFGPAQQGKDFSEWKPAVVRTSPTVGPKIFSYAPELLKMVLDADLDLVHLNGLWMYTSMVSMAFTRRTGRPHFISPHGMLDGWALANSGWKKRIAALLFEREHVNTAACIHSLNASETASIRAYGYKGPVAVIPYCIDLPGSVDGVDKVDGAPLAPPWWTKNGTGIKTLLYLGRLHPKKGLPNLLTAWSRLAPEMREQWQLVIAGWDEHGHKLGLRRMANALRIEKSVTFSGAVFGDEKRAAFRYCDGFVLPSYSEGLPMVLLESMAWGKPVLMTPQCNLPEGFDAGAAVRMEPAMESVKEALTRFLTMSDAERDAMGAKGRALAAARFSTPVIAAKMAAVYRWLAGRGPRPDTVTES